MKSYPGIDWRLGAMVLLLPLLLSAAPALTAAESEGATVGLPGTWVGALVMDRARFEVDLIVEVARGDRGDLHATLTQPVQGVSGELHDIVVDGRQVSFVYRDDTGDSRFRGELSQDRLRLAGKMLEGDREYDFYLQRRPGLPDPRPLVELSGDNLELVESFNEGAGRVRLLTMLSPTCGTCLYTARAIQRYLLDEVASEQLQVHLVWGQMLDADDREAAAAATVHMPDPRVVHYWTDDPVLAMELRRPLPLEDGSAWDVFFVYPPDARWRDAVPQPSSYMHQMQEKLPPENLFDAVELVRRIRALLPSS